MKLLQVFFGIFISTVCFYISVRQIDFSSLAESFEHIHIGWMVIANIGILGSQWIRSARWARLLKPLQPISSLKSFQIYSVGNLANLLIPLRGGDILRAWMMARHLSKGKSAILATIITERLVDLIFFGLLLGSSLLLYSLPEWLMMSGVLLFLGSLGLGAFLAVLKIKALSLNILWKILRTMMPELLVERIQRLITGFLEGLAPLSTSREYIAFFAETLLMWGAQGLFIYLLFYSFGFTKAYDLGLDTVLLMLALTTAAVTVPSAPSYAGTLHLMAMMSLEICGVPATEAFSYAVALHALGTLIGVMLGLYGLLAERLKFFQNRPIKLC